MELIAFTRSRRWLATPALSLGLVALFAAPAAAASVQVTGGPWYALETASAPSSSPVPVSVPALPTPDVPDGDFPVAVRAGQADRETFLHLDTSVIPHGATVPKLVLLLTEDANGGNANAESARIEALAVKSYFADGSKGASFDSRPDVDTSSASAPGVRGAGGAWTFDITPIVQKWADGTLANNGIGLVASSPTPADTWEVVWIGTGAQGPRTEGTVQVPAPAPPPASGSSAAPTPAPAATVELTPAPPLTPAPAVASPPATALPQIETPPVHPIQTIAAAGRSRHGIAGALWLALLLVLGFVLASMVALGEAGEPVLERRGSVLRALERRAHTS